MNKLVSKFGAVGGTIIVAATIAILLVLLTITIQKPSAVMAKFDHTTGCVLVTQDTTLTFPQYSHGWTAYSEETFYFRRRDNSGWEDGDGTWQPVKVPAAQGIMLPGFADSLDIEAVADTVYVFFFQ